MPYAFEDTLAQRLQVLIGGDLSYSRPLARVRGLLEDMGWQCALFGGLARHLLGTEWRAVPRDIDLVVADPHPSELLRVMSEVGATTNRWGGTRAIVEGVTFDVWSVSETWGFSRLPELTRTFRNLPRTTFLNIEAVAIELPTDDAQAIAIHGERFIEALSTRRLEVNLEENPYPEACVVRGLVIAITHDLALGRRLRTVIERHRNLLTDTNVAAIQIAHYGAVVVEPHHIRTWVSECLARHEDQQDEDPQDLQTAPPVFWPQLSAE